MEAGDEGVALEADIALISPEKGTVFDEAEDICMGGGAGDDAQVAPAGTFGTADGLGKIV